MLYGWKKAEAYSGKVEGNPGKRKLNTKNRIRVRECPTVLHGYCLKRRQRGSGYRKTESDGSADEIDRSAFAAYCQSYARWKEAQNTSILRVLPMKRRMVCRDRIRGLLSVIRNSDL